MTALASKVAIITGAGRGIGAATAFQFAKNGANITITSRSESELFDIQAKLNREFPDIKVFTIAGDLSDSSFRERLVFETIQNFGKIDILVNNAADILVKPFIDVEENEWDDLIGINLKALYFLTQRVVKEMIPAHQGRIINIASLAGVNNIEKFPGLSVYSLTKAAVINFTELLSVELKKHHIQINAIAPGAVNTQMFTTAFPGASSNTEPDIIAKHILNLACPIRTPHLTGSTVVIQTNE